MSSPENIDDELRLDAVLDGPEAGGIAIRGGAIRVVGYGVASLLGLVSVPLLTRHLGPASYGDFVAVGAIAFIVGGLTDAGLTNIGIREYSVRRESERRHFLAALLGLRLVLTCVGVAAALALIALTGAKPVIIAGTAIMGLAVALTLLQITYTVPLTAELRFGRITALELLRQSVTTATVVLLVAAGASLVPFFWTAALAAAVTLATTLVVIRPNSRIWPRFDRQLWRAIALEAIPYTFALAGGFLYFRLAVVLMSYLSSGAETGYYGAAFRITEVIGVLPWLAVSAAFPILARAAVNDSARMQYALQQLFEVAVVVGTGMCLAMLVGAPVAISVIAGPDYVGAEAPLRVLALAQLTLFLVATWVYALLALREYRVIMMATLVATAVATLGTLLLQPSLGAVGAAIATAAADGVLACWYIASLVRIDKGYMPDLAFVPRYLLLLALVGVIAVVLFDQPLLAALVVSVLYAAGVVALRLIPKPLANALPGPLPRLLGGDR